VDSLFLKYLLKFNVITDIEKLCVTSVDEDKEFNHFPDENA
jgi:hypothetical protein